MAENYAEKVRKYRQIENDMKVFNDSLQVQFKKQQEEMSKLEVENYKLLEELQILEMQRARDQKEQTVALKASEVQEQEVKELLDKIERETGTSKRLDEKVKNLQKDIIE